MGASESYSEAYNLHYKAKDLNGAYNSYLRIIKRWPASRERGYAETQIENILSSGFQVKEDEDTKSVAEAMASAREKQKAIEEERANAHDANVKKKDQVSKLADKIVMTTCPAFEEYKTKRTLGIVSGETILKASFLERMGSGIQDFFDGLSLSEQEMTGSVSLLENARKYAFDKMKRRAAELGANALVGVDMETAFGASGIIHITVYGTAVVVEPFSESEVIC